MTAIALKSHAQENCKLSNKPEKMPRRHASSLVPNMSNSPALYIEKKRKQFLAHNIELQIMYPLSVFDSLPGQLYIKFTC